MTDDATPITFVFASQIEDATISILWHEPERLAAFLRDLDPAVHLTQPALGHILEAINLVYRESGSTDWALVVQTLRDLKTLEEAGGLQGLNRIYSLKEIRPAKSIVDAIWAEYVRLLKDYAIGRAQNPPLMPYRFNRGDVQLFKNKKRSPVDYDWIGSAKVAGKHFRAKGRDTPNGIDVSLTPN